MSGPNTPTKGTAIIWAGDLVGGVRIRDTLRTQGYFARVVDSREFHRDRVVFKCSLLVFCASREQVEIEAAYKSVGWTGETLVVGLDGKPVPHHANTAMSPQAVSQPSRQQVETPPPAPPPPPAPSPPTAPEPALQGSSKPAETAAPSPADKPKAAPAKD